MRPSCSSWMRTRSPSRLGLGTVFRYVAPTGSDTNNDCTEAATPCLTLAHAVSQADAGDTLDVAAGVYVEPGLVVDKALLIQGQGVVVR